MNVSIHIENPLKTTNFEIDSVFETEKIKKDEYKRVFKGYKYSHVLKNKLLEKAVKDSRVKAEVLAKAAEMKLDELVSIDYSWGELKLTTSPYGRLRMLCH